MKYKLNGTDIAVFGALPHVNRSQSCIAISGIFDLPKRKGTTEYNWGTSIEPFVDAEDIELDGRTLTLSLCIKHSDYKRKLNALKNACIACRKLWTEFGEFDIVLKDELSVEEYISLNMVIVKVKFWQQIFTPASITITPSGGSSYVMDGFNLYKDFSIVIISRKDFENIGKRIEISTTKPYIQTEYREAHDITLGCSMIGKNINNLYNKISQFNALCISPGIRNLYLRDNEYCCLYFKDGITVTARTDRLLNFNLKCRIVQ